MDQEIYQKLIKSIRNYYPVGVTPSENDYHKIADLTKEKIDFLIEKSTTNEILKKWETFSKWLQVQFSENFINLDYLQFPSLIGQIKFTKQTAKFKEESAFVFSISLLCPFCTYFNEYNLYKEADYGGSGNYWFPMSRKRFLENKSLHDFRPDLSYKSIVKKLFEVFEGYQYVNYYALETTFVTSVLPFKSNLDSYSSSKEYSLYDLLFESKNNGSIDITY